MPLSLHLVTSDADFDAIVACEWPAYETPPNPAWKFLHPIWGTQPCDRAAAVQGCKRRQLETHRRAEPGVSNWVKVVDDDDDSVVVGAALWYVFERNPYGGDGDGKEEAGEGEEGKKKKEGTCVWWPEGPKRVMADEMMRQVMGPRVERMGKPHLLLDLCFVHPSHRRRGAGRLLVEWGTRKADALGLEAFVESTLAGKPLYESCGFVATNGFELDPTPPEDTDELRQLRRDLRFYGYFMWRPVGGVFERGKTVVPWEHEA